MKMASFQDTNGYTTILPYKISIKMLLLLLFANKIRIVEWWNESQPSK